ncbi:MAG: peptidase S8 [Deltaproteobacteria bacterium]|nr:peptidase S8 [Deltaproteobacteria bacterium]
MPRSKTLPQEPQRHLAIGLSVLMAGLLPSVAEAQQATAAPTDGPRLAPHETLLIDLKDDTSDADAKAIEAIARVGLHLNSIHAADERFFVGDVAPSELEATIARLRSDPRVENVEPNYMYEALGVPNDPMFEKQWSMKMVGAPAAWSRADGRGVVVAVIDTGVAYEDYKKFRRVEDLAGTKFVKGYDFVHDTEHANDDHGHGTHVAGTIAQTTNNRIGVAGLAYGATIMPLKVLSKRGAGTAADIADAIRYAADEGAQVINLSLGGGMRSFIMEAAVAYARKKNVVVVCAAGNNARARVEYPAAYKGAFAVSSVGPDRKLAFYSSYGKELAIAAPGGDKQSGGESGAILQNTILPTEVGATNRYLYFQGTSMATPHVAAAAALVISQGVTSAEKVEQILKETAVDAGPANWDERYGYGILNVDRATEVAAQTVGGASSAALALTMLLGILGLRRLAPSSFCSSSFASSSVGPDALRGWELIAAFLSATATSSGFFFLRALVPTDHFGGVVAELAAMPIPSWDLALAGPAYATNALWASLLPAALVVIGLLRVRALRGPILGAAIGWATYLFMAAFHGAQDVRLIPGTAGFLDRTWLIGNAAILVGLAVLFVRASFTIRGKGSLQRTEG